MAARHPPLHTETPAARPPRPPETHSSLTKGREGGKWHRQKPKAE